jgi:hypothetical protein
VSREKLSHHDHHRRPELAVHAFERSRDTQGCLMYGGEVVGSGGDVWLGLAWLVEWADQAASVASWLVNPPPEVAFRAHTTLAILSSRREEDALATCLALALEVLLLAPIN